MDAAPFWLVASRLESPAAAHADMFNPNLHIHVAHFPSIPRGSGTNYPEPLFRVGTRASTIQVHAQLAPHLIHAHTEAAAYGVLPVARKLGIPLVITLPWDQYGTRALDTQWKKSFLSALNDAARVVFVGERLRAHWLASRGTRTISGWYRMASPFRIEMPILESNEFGHDRTLDQRLQTSTKERGST